MERGEYVLAEAVVRKLPVPEEENTLILAAVERFPVRNLEIRRVFHREVDRKNTEGDGNLRPELGSRRIQRREHWELQ